METYLLFQGKRMPFTSVKKFIYYSILYHIYNSIWKIVMKWQFKKRFHNVVQSQRYELSLKAGSKNNFTDFPKQLLSEAMKTHLIGNFSAWCYLFAICLAWVKHGQNFDIIECSLKALDDELRQDVYIYIAHVVSCYLMLSRYLML